MTIRKKTKSKTKRKSNTIAPPAKMADLARLHAFTGSGHAPKPPVKWDPSPNFASRQGETIQKLVLHNTAGPLAPSLARLKDPKQQVSAHYVVDRNGDIYQLVQDSETAWHSGNKTVNQQSIGIETVAWSTATGMTAAQESALVSVAKFVLEAYGISLSNVLPHRAIKPTDCPGFIWPSDTEFDSWKNSKLS